MKLNIATTKEAKTLVSAVRRELQALNKGTAALSHNDCLNVLAKAQGYASWNAWEATMGSGEPQLEATPAKVMVPKYPLTNHNGEFDFIKPGEEGIPLQGDFEPLENTVERVEAKAYVRSAHRATDPRNPGLGTSNLHVQHSGSDIFEDTMETEVRKGNVVWLSDGGDEYDGVVVLAPIGNPYPQYDGELPVRAKLLQAYLEYYTEHGVDDSTRENILEYYAERDDDDDDDDDDSDGATDDILENAEAILGIRLTERELRRLLNQLREKGLV